MPHQTFILLSMKKSNAVHEHQAVFQEETEGGFSVWVPDLLGCASHGETLEESLKNIKEAIELYLEDSHIKMQDSQGRTAIIPNNKTY